jgi:hypothetical protein
LGHSSNTWSNERKKQGKIRWDNDKNRKMVTNDTHLRTSGPKRQFRTRFATNFQPKSTNEASLHPSCQYGSNECTYVRNGGVLMFWVVDVVGMQWGWEGEAEDREKSKGNDEKILIVPLLKNVNYYITSNESVLKLIECTEWPDWTNQSIGNRGCQKLRRILRRILRTNPSELIG